MREDTIIVSFRKDTVRKAMPQKEGKIVAKVFVVAME